MILPDILETYLERCCGSEPAVLQQLSDETEASVRGSQMLSGHYQGRVLSLISKMLRPKAILEVGSYTGYASICLAEGLAEGGRLYALELDIALKPIQDKYFKLAGLSDKIIQRFGKAQDIIPRLDDVFDLAFIDADKSRYGLYFDLVMAKMRPGGVIVSDNVLWRGGVYAENPDRKTRKIMDYNEKLSADPRVDTVILPVRDGLSVAFVK